MFRRNRYFYLWPADDANTAAGTGAPAATTEPKVEVVTQPAADEDNLDASSEVFATFAEEDIAGGGDEDAAPVVVQTPKPDEKKVVTPAAQPVVNQASTDTTTTVTTTTVDTTTTTSPTTTVVQTTVEEVVPVKSEAERVAEATAARTKALETLATQYAIAEEDQSALISEPEKVLPKILAQAHARIMDNVQAYVNSVLPNMVRGLRTQDEQVAEGTKKFFGEWPELNKPEHMGAVARILQGYRQANPQAKPEDVIREGGIAALVALRIPIPERVLKVHNAGAPDATKPAAFAPVSGPGSTHAAPQQGEQNAFTVLAEEDLTER